MNNKNLLLGIFVLLTVVFASLTLSEYEKVNTLNSQLLSQSRSTSTQTLTTTVTIASTVTRLSNTTYGSFSYTPTGQVQVDSVRAIESLSQNGRLNVTFWVTFENIGNSPIYAIGGWAGELYSTPTGNSSVLQEAPSLRCPGANFIVTLNHGQNYTVYAPDCSTGFNYQLVRPGSVNVRLSFDWTTDHQEMSPFSNSTTISANFTFA